MDRRAFFETLAGGAILASAARKAVFGAENTGESAKLRLSTSSIHFMHLPIEQALERIAALGFQAVDIWSAYAGCPHLDDALNRLKPDGLRALLERTKLKLFSFSVYVGGYPRYAELLGASGGGVAIRGSAGPCEPAQLKQRMAEFLESLKPEIELAEKHQTRLAIENHGSSLLDSLDSFKAFVDMNRSPHVGIALAPYHLQAGKIPVEETIRVCGKQLFFFYAWQHGNDRDQLPGHGPTDFAPWLSALSSSGYEGFVNPFMHGDLAADEMAAALTKSRDYLNAKAPQR
jgi:sugar phosphate isomerase/epimerase